MKLGKKTTKASSVFSKHGDQEFHDAFSEMIETAYADLFSLHGKESWNLSDDKLISFFRGADHTSAIVGQRQAGTFQALAGLCGHGELPTLKTRSYDTSIRSKESEYCPSKEDSI